MKSYTNILIGVMLGLLSFVGGETALELYDRWSNKKVESVVQMEQFVNHNNSKSIALNEPTPSDILYVRWSWGLWKDHSYCYFYKIREAATGFEASIPGRCNPKGFFKDTDANFFFNSSVGVKLPFGLHPGEYELTYFHQPQDDYHVNHNIWYTFDPIPFTVK